MNAPPEERALLNLIRALLHSYEEDGGDITSLSARLIGMSCAFFQKQVGPQSTIEHLESFMLMIKERYGDTRTKNTGGYDA
jgi:hypothetical protein